jgi:hypothetical protein
MKGKSGSIVAQRWNEDLEKLSRVVLSPRVMQAFRSSMVLSVLTKISQGVEIKRSIWISKEDYGYVIRTSATDVRIIVNTSSDTVYLIFMKIIHGKMTPLFFFKPQEFFTLVTSELLVCSSKKIIK